jgi:hypothetical protein
MRGLPFRLLVVLCLLAATAQGFVAQTHVHSHRDSVASIAGGAAAQLADALSGDEPKCVLCDIAGHSPSFAPPLAVASTLDLDPTCSLRPAARRAVLVGSPSHHWSGRGPPSNLNTSV